MIGGRLNSHLHYVTRWVDFFAMADGFEFAAIEFLHITPFEDELFYIEKINQLVKPLEKQVFGILFLKLHRPRFGALDPSEVSDDREQAVSGIGVGFSQVLPVGYHPNVGSVLDKFKPLQRYPFRPSLQDNHSPLLELRDKRHH